MARPALEIADIFRDHGPAWRKANAGHVSLGQLKVMSAIESCRTVALGGHVMRCEDCLHTQIAYNSCRNRHCPKCQGSQASIVANPDFRRCYRNSSCPQKGWVVAKLEIKPLAPSSVADSQVAQY